MNKGTGCHQTVAKPLRVTAALFAVLITATATAQGELSPPDWPDLFNANGTLKDVVDATGAAGSNGVPDYVDRYGGTDAIFIGDNISNGIAADMSALSDADNLEDVIVFNGTVQTMHDVGNAFVYAKIDVDANLVLYGAAERLGSTSASSHVEFEFTQQFVQAIGANVPLRGNRTEDDLLIRLNLYQGALSSAEIKRWTPADGYQTVVTITVSPGSACSGDGQIHLVCDPYLASGQFDYETPFEPWSDSPRDMLNTPVEVPAPSGLLEFGINVGDLIGTSPNYSSILVRTPEDIILDSFRNIGYWAQVN